jgi:hypothetical protein
MIWLIGLVVTFVAVIGGLKLHHSDGPRGDEIAPAPATIAFGHAPAPVAEIHLPDRPLRPGELPAMRDRITRIAATWFLRPRHLAPPPSPYLPRITPHLRPLPRPDLLSARHGPIEAGIESFVKWLEQQGCVAAVRIPRDTAEGAIAYGMTASYPAQVPVEVDLRTTPTYGATEVETYRLYLPLDSAPHMVQTRN